MKKIVLLILLVVFLMPNLYLGPAFSQAQTTPGQEEALKSYLQQQQQQKAQQQQAQQQQQKESQATQEPSANGNQAALPGLSKAILVIYVLTFLLLWIFLVLWIATLLRWTKQKKIPPVEIGRKIN